MYPTNRDLILELLKNVEPDDIEQRRHRHLKKHRFWCAGVNDVWPQDQHNKWGRFGIWLHCSLEAFSGEINWLRVWWTNKNPKLVASYFINKCRQIKGKLLRGLLVMHFNNRYCGSRPHHYPE